MAKFTFDYLNAAEKMAEKGEFESALHYYFLERNRCPSSDIDICIGDTYVEMGLPREAIKYYMHAHAEDQHNFDAIEGLIYCYKDIDEEAAFYYLHCVLKQSADDFEEIGISSEEEIRAPLTVHDKKDKSEVLNYAFDMLESGKIEEAKEAFKSIDDKSYQFCDATLALASMEMEKSNFSEALKMADEALSVNPAHMNAHVLKVMAYDALGDRDKMDEWIKRLDALAPRDEDEVTKAAICLSNYKYYDIAEKYLMRKLEFSPYDRFTMLCLSAIYASRGDEAGAFKMAGRVCAVYPDDVEVKEIASRILARKAVKIPHELLELKREWTEDIKNLFLSGNNAITDPENIKKIKWLLQGEEELYLQSAVCAFVACMPEYSSLMQEVLMDPFAPHIVKKQILLRLVCDEKTKRINVVMSNIFRSIKVRHPKVADNLRYAYYYAFVAAAVTDLHFEGRFNKQFKKLETLYEQCEDPQKEELSINSLAAHIFYMVEGGSLDKILELFDCERETFDNVATMLGIQGRRS